MLKDFAVWVDAHSVWMRFIHDIANGTKHVREKQMFETMRVVSLPFSFDTLHAGFDKETWDCPIRYVQGDIPVGKDVLMALRNKDRHPCVQDFMLANDACTIACEVPVYLTSVEIAYYKSADFYVDLPESATPITGHIDVVQVRNGFIHLLDYEPKAAAVNPVNPLLVYALALASRTRLPLKLFKCAWFDERDYFEFFPLQAVHALQPSRRPTQ